MGVRDPLAHRCVMGRSGAIVHAPRHSSPAVMIPATTHTTHLTPRHAHLASRIAPHHTMAPSHTRRTPWLRYLCHYNCIQGTTRRCITQANPATSRATTSKKTRSGRPTICEPPTALKIGARTCPCSEASERGRSNNTDQHRAPKTYYSSDQCIHVNLKPYGHA